MAPSLLPPLSLPFALGRGNASAMVTGTPRHICLGITRPARVCVGHQVLLFLFRKLISFLFSQETVTGETWMANGLGKGSWFLRG